MNSDVAAVTPLTNRPSRAAKPCSFTRPTQRNVTSSKGEIVRVFNDRGTFRGPAVLYDALMPGLIMVNVGHWQNNSSDSTVNSITADRHSNVGRAGVYSANLVDVEKIGQPAGI